MTSILESLLNDENFDCGKASDNMRNHGYGLPDALSRLFNKLSSPQFEAFQQSLTEKLNQLDFSQVDLTRSLPSDTFAERTQVFIDCNAVSLLFWHLVFFEHAYAQVFDKDGNVHPFIKKAEKPELKDKQGQTIDLSDEAWGIGLMQTYFQLFSCFSHVITNERTRRLDPQSNCENTDKNFSVLTSFLTYFPLKLKTPAEAKQRIALIKTRLASHLALNTEVSRIVNNDDDLIELYTHHYAALDEELKTKFDTALMTRAQAKDAANHAQFKHLANRCLALAIRQNPRPLSFRDKLNLGYNSLSSNHKNTMALAVALGAVFVINFPPLIPGVALVLGFAALSVYAYNNIDYMNCSTQAQRVYPAQQSAVNEQISALDEQAVNEQISALDEQIAETLHALGQPVHPERSESLSDDSLNVESPEDSEVESPENSGDDGSNFVPESPRDPSLIEIDSSLIEIDSSPRITISARPQGIFSIKGTTEKVHEQPSQKRGLSPNGNG